MRENLKIIIDPSSTHFGEVGRPWGYKRHDYMDYVEFDSGYGTWIHKRWLKDPDFPVTHPDRWLKAVDLSTRHRLSKSTFNKLRDIAHYSASEAFFGEDEDSRDMAKTIIFGELAEPIRGSEGEAFSDIQSFFLEDD